MRRVLVFIFFLIAVATLGSGCVRKITIPETLPVNPEVSTSELINRINAYSDVKTFSAQGTIYVRNYFTGKSNKAEEFPGGNQLIRLQRPENIRLRVSAPVIGSQVADMVSDGQQFRLAIYYPSKKRRFIYGSSLASYERMAAEAIEESKNPQLAEAGGLINMRPQHITDSFLIKPTSLDDRSSVFREEARHIEPDTRSGKRGRMVERSYYVIYVLERADNGRIELRRKFWFDRTQQGTPLVRQQTFENGVGRLASDMTYSDWFNVAGLSQRWPGRVVIDRRNDGYRVELILEKDSIEINEELPSTTFVLENTERLEEINLDTPRKSSAEQNHKPETASHARKQ